jgi:hypothetical protein
VRKIEQKKILFNLLLLFSRDTAGQVWIDFFVFFFECIDLFWNDLELLQHHIIEQQRY